MKAKYILAALGAAALLLFAAPLAGAASSSQAGYEESAPLGQVGGEEGGGGESGDVSQTTASAEPTAESGNGTLPFTGMELSLVALLGIALIGTGFLLKRVSRPPRA
jgi:hypothetical protein